MDANASVSGGSAAYPHAVKYYKDEEALGRTVAEFLSRGLRDRLPAIVIATPEHRQLITKELTKRDLDVPRLEAEGALHMLDADEVLAQFMVGQSPDPTRFFQTVDTLIERACKGRKPCPVRAYGEMVDVLWKRANPNGAIQLEVLWNRVSTYGEFSLLCGYAIGNFYKEIPSRPSIQSVSAQHNHIISDEASF
jgi:hypothetical protein